ncbi:MAG TPA: ABC transporter permease, partial [Roseiflexaceae bacterium]|nr:ABC transporter permease [Roseiflexaceae bacterium]
MSNANLPYDMRQRLNRDWVSVFVQKYAIVLILIAMIIVVSFLSPVFLQPVNLLNIVRQISVIGLIAMGVTVAIISTGIDLSSGSIVGLASVVAASLAQQPDWPQAKYPGLELPLIVALMGGLGVGLACGFVNGFLIAKFKIPPFIATLGMMTAARGLALLYSNGRPLSSLTDAYNFIGAGAILGIPLPIIILALVGVGTHVMLNYTKFGRYIYAIGGNELAARFSGLNLDRVKIGIYTFAGLLAGLAGIVVSSRISSGQPGLGVGYELDAITAAVIGGTSLSGGIGTVWGTVVGALIIGVLNNSLDLLNVSAYWQQILKGAIIVIAIIID